MADYQVTVKLRQFGASWSENWYATSGLSPTGLLDLMAGRTADIMSFRHPATVLTSVRVRNVLSTRNSSVRKFSVSNAGPTGSPDLVQTCVPLILEANNGQGRTMSVRGVPDPGTMRSSTTGASNTAYFTLPIANYVVLMIATGGAIRHTFPAQPAGLYAWQNVLTLGVDVTRPAWTKIQLLGDAIVPAAGSTIYFRGFVNGTFTYLKGNFEVKEANDGGHYFFIGATWREPISTVGVTNVQMRRRTYTYDAFTGYSLGEYFTRKTGDPTLGRRGRRSKQVRRQFPLVG